MKGILEFVILIAVLVVARSTYIAIKSGVIKHKYASVIAVFKEYGYHGRVRGKELFTGSN